MTKSSEWMIGVLEFPMTALIWYGVGGFLVWLDEGFLDFIRGL